MDMLILFPLVLCIIAVVMAAASWAEGEDDGEWPLR